MTSASSRSLTTRCCIVGGGPCGMMLGFLLARAGVPVVVLEKHGDFLRDFRADTIHLSRLKLMHELGLRDEFLKLPHSNVRQLSGQIGATRITIADFSHLPTRCKYIAFMPQRDFLDFLAAQGKRYPAFDLRMRTEETALIEEGGRVVGVRAETPDGTIEVHAELTVGADGRHSTVREHAGFAVNNLGAPMDVLWFRLSRRPDDKSETFGHVEAGRMLIMLNRGHYWQCAYLIAKDDYDAVRRAGIGKFRAAIVEMSPFVRDHVDEIKSWDDVKLLTVAVDRMPCWCKPGLICIGDAAHAMSPIGGVGINLAVQDAVAAANILAEPLRTGEAKRGHLEKIQQRREIPTRVTQRLQLLIQDNVIDPILRSTARPKPP